MDEIVPQKKQNPQTDVEKNNILKNIGEPASIGGRPEPHLDAGGKTLKGLQEANAVNNFSQPNSVDKDAIIANLHKNQTVPTLRTLESDVVEATKQHELSTVSIVAQKIQQKGEESEKQAASEKKGVFKKISLSVAAIILIVLSVAILGYAYIITRPQPLPTGQSNTSLNNLIAVDDTKTVSISPQQNSLAAWLGAEKLLTTENATIVKINITAAGTTTPLDSQTFLNDWGTLHIPGWFIRALGPQYLAGFYHNGSAWDPFLILSIASYDNAVAGMLQWENNMASDLAPLYALTTSTDTTPPQSQNTSSTTGAQTTPIILSVPPTFSDTFVNNKNVRMLAVPNQKPLILYSFPQQNVLVITTSKMAMSEIFNRLVTQALIH